MLVGIPLVCELLFVGILSALLHQSNAELDSIQRAQRIVSLLDEMMDNAVFGIEITQNYKLQHIGSSRRLVELIKSTHEEFEQLKWLPSDTPEEKNLADTAARGGSLLEGIQVLRDTIA